jgi:hypothetical protein
MRAIAVLIILGLGSLAFADDKVDWSQYVESKSDAAKPMPVAKAKPASKPVKKAPAAKKSARARKKK